MRVREDVCYCLNRTLLGKKLMIGIKEKNSFVTFSGDYVSKVTDFIDKYKREDIPTEDLSDEDIKICKSLDKIGYLDTSVVSSKETFNEFKKMGKVLFRICPKNSSSKAIGNNKFGAWAFILSAIFMAGFCYFNRNYMPANIDYVNMRIWEILLTIILFPPLIMAFHELGHCIAAWFQGVKIASISLGWFFIYPLVLVQYLGINLETQRQKLIVIAGGVYMNLLMAAIGVGLKAFFPTVFFGAVIDIWILANISTIITNVGLFGMTDGYFMFTTVVGVMDLRMKGYKYLNSKLRKARINLRNTYRLCGWLLIGLYLNGIVNIYIQINYISSLFHITKWIMYVVLSVFVALMSIKFLQRVKKAF
ncbi:hypothetical protein PAJ34TS1_17900 [Paenibacillus azoreducens]|uniref:Peptidase M50 domain-containing protein n=2 Tax=Paenibacillus TaxID=44249 RepID=A0A919YHA0_9BACL|nr:hypothetical protein J34TS1_39700 [Paenibacillus azoreducens]